MGVAPKGRSVVDQDVESSAEPAQRQRGHTLDILILPQVRRDRQHLCSLNRDPARAPRPLRERHDHGPPAPGATPPRVQTGAPASRPKPRDAPVISARFPYQPLHLNLLDTRYSPSSGIVRTVQTWRGLGSSRCSLSTTAIDYVMRIGSAGRAGKRKGRPFHLPCLNPVSGPALCEIDSARSRPADPRHLLSR